MLLNIIWQGYQGYTHIQNILLFQLLSLKCSVAELGKLKTRGPRGPWVAHLRKRSKVTV